MEIKQVYTLFLFLIINNAISASLFAQVKGVMYNSKTSKPLENATVFINSVEPDGRDYGSSRRIIASYLTETTINIVKNP